LNGLRHAETMKTSGANLSSPAAAAQPEAEAPWSTLIPAEQWATFRRGTGALENAAAPFLLHGAMALATYTGHWRNTKDVDVIVRPADHQRAIAALYGAGFEDYFEQLPYDRSWIFRGWKDGTLFDLIWALPNHRVAIDEAWFERARPLRLHGSNYAAVGPEELIRVKLYVMQRERCDWVDVLNVMAAVTAHIDWAWLVERMGRDLALLQGALAVFNWLCPARAGVLPGWVRERFALPPIHDGDLSSMEERRVRLFDSRPWFALHQPMNQPLER
jgi:hypothetical protein